MKLGCLGVNLPILLLCRTIILRFFRIKFQQIKTGIERLVGRLIYLSHTRPDIAYAVSVVSQFMHSPSEIHMEAVMRILQYLKSAPGKGLMFSKHGHLEIEGFTDADWAGNRTDRRSTSAEYRSMVHGVCEMLWIRKLLKELGFVAKDAMKLYCDNQAAIDIANNPVQHDRTKHVEIDRHFINEKLESNVISVPHVKSEEQLADILTKAVSSHAFSDSLDKLGIGDIYAPT
ncbi:unnamed protein product [Prunus brigantina]